MNKKIRTLIVDDSILFRETLSRGLGKDNSIEVIGTAQDPYDARDKILELHPDVITLDVEMPKMNGIDFLKKLIPQYPIPVVVVTSLPLNAFEAIEAGAVDFVNKPAVKSPADMERFINDLSSKVKIASRAQVGAAHRVAPSPVMPTSRVNVLDQARLHNFVIAIGASTGGTDATQVVIENLPPTTPPILVTQHMPAGFTKMYAERLNKVCKMDVKEAENGDRLRPGLILVAPGELQMRLARDPRGFYVKVAPGEKVSGHCPSVDVLFDSVAEHCGKKAMGVILTGMGSDGAKGLLAMKSKGAYTIGQDQASCVVYGMPMVAFNIGAVDKQSTLTGISNIMLNKLSSL